MQLPARCLEMSLGALDVIPSTLAAASQILWEATTRLAMEASVTEGARAQDLCHSLELCLSLRLRRSRFMEHTS